MLIKDFLKKFVFGRMNKYGLTSKINAMGMIGLVEGGLSRIYNLTQQDKTKFHNWQVRAEVFPFIGQNIRLQTDFPIMEVKSFYTGDKPTILEFNEINHCGEITTGGFCSECNTQCSSSCDDVWGNYNWLEMIEKTAGAKLGCNEYQIATGRNSGGYRGQVIMADVGSYNKDKAIWVEYYAGYNPLDCYDDDINIPHPLLPALADFMISDALDVYGVSKESISANIYQKGFTLLLAFNEGDSRSLDLNKIDTRNSNKQGGEPIRKTTTRFGAGNITM